uniref:Uncharacterized protein n=1 Tax=Phlebotomus papatasi TaxID=29031 RepID=A0A1B0CYN2_PHLPP
MTRPHIISNTHISNHKGYSEFVGETEPMAFGQTAIGDLIVTPQICHFHIGTRICCRMREIHPKHRNPVRGPMKAQIQQAQR